MPAIVKKLTIAASPQRIFTALTQQDDIASWWTDDLRVEPKVGSLAIFRFRNGAFALQLEVAELEEGSKVHWITRKADGAWAGTNVTWQLEPVHNETQVLFTHDGFTQVDSGYEAISATWDYFLASLKSYLETGKGTPGYPSN